MFGAVQSMKDRVAIFAGHVQFARIPALSGGKDYTSRHVFLWGRRPAGATNAQRAHFQSAAGLLQSDQTLAGPDVQPVLLHNLTPARQQVLLAGSLEPQLPRRRQAVGLG